MRSIFVLAVTVSLALAVCVVECTPARQRRDVNELVTYLPPNEDSAQSEALLQNLSEPAAEEEEIVSITEPEELARDVVIEDVPEQLPEQPSETAVLGADGYEYKTVRQVRYRHRRDVSHLKLDYLPPVSPPVSPPSRDYLPPRLTNEYLPPMPEEISSQIVEEVPTEVPAVRDVTTEPIVVEEVPEVPEAPVETAILDQSGYHYRRPAIIPDLSQPIVTDEVLPSPEEIPEPVPEMLPEVTEARSKLPEEEVLVEEVPETPIESDIREYLPPLDKEAVVVEGPGEETAVLADDGYHYRTVRRLRY